MPRPIPKREEIGERIQAAIDALWPLRCQAVTENMCWIGGDDGDAGIDFCRSCAELEVAHLQKQHPGKEFCVDGGYDGSRESDTSAACCKCGRMLGYSLTDYGARSELGHFLKYVPRRIDPPIAYELVAMLQGIVWSKWPDDLADAVRVGESAVSLIGFDLALARLTDDGGIATS